MEIGWKIKNPTCLHHLLPNLWGKTVSYSTNIETPSSSHPDLPLHRMAAKYQIKDLEVNDEGMLGF
jgi:hypothetical protein